MGPLLGQPEKQPGGPHPPLGQGGSEETVPGGLEVTAPLPTAHTHRLNSSRGLAAWEWAEGEACSGRRLLAKACRCFSSSRTTSTCSSVGMKDSWGEGPRQYLVLGCAHLSPHGCTTHGTLGQPPGQKLCHVLPCTSTPFMEPLRQTPSVLRAQLSVHKGQEGL